MRLDSSHAIIVQRLVDLFAARNRYPEYGTVIFGGFDKTDRLIFPQQGAPASDGPVDRLVILTGGHHNMLGVVGAKVNDLLSARVTLDPVGPGLIKVTKDDAAVTTEEAITSLLEKQLLVPQGSIGIDHRFQCTAVVWDEPRKRAIICAGGTGIESPFRAEIWKAGQCTDRAEVPMEELDDMPDIYGGSYIRVKPDGRIIFGSDLKIDWESDASLRHQPALACSMDI